MVEILGKAPDRFLSLGVSTLVFQIAMATNFRAHGNKTAKVRQMTIHAAMRQTAGL